MMIDIWRGKGIVKYTHDHRHTCMETGEIKVHVKYTHDDRHTCMETGEIKVHVKYTDIWRSKSAR